MSACSGRTVKCLLTNWNSNNEVNNIQPLPTFEPVFAVQIGHDCTLHNARKQGAALSSSCELMIISWGGLFMRNRAHDGGTLTQLPVFIPGAKNILHRWAGCPMHAYTGKAHTWVPLNVDASNNACTNRMPQTWWGVLTPADFSACLTRIWMDAHRSNQEYTAPKLACKKGTRILVKCGQKREWAQRAIDQ